MEDGAKFEHTLERLLIESRDSVAAGPRFYRELLQSQVLICPHGEIEGADDPNRATATLRMATITHNDLAYVPFYLAEKHLPAGIRYVAIPARTFFEITKGSHLILNPGSEVGKAFTPDEVAKLLSGTLMAHEKEFQVKKSSKVLVGRPNTVPPHLLEELSRLFQAEAGVQRAWLAWYHNTEAEKAAGYLLGIETTRSVNFRTLVGSVSLVLKQVGTGGHYCDIVQADGKGLTRYFQTDQPFYSKPLWQRLKASVLG